ncbi:alpha-tubulin binding [Tritrichomonas musculus]|uniref:Alpha-tubulin binding n=1 Tax=Tritrichomonas musculus TaxID=1915356 RepID=A0ABR2JPN3_9EUKA
MDGLEFPNYYSPITQFMPKIEPEKVTGHSIQYNEAFTNVEYKEDETFNFQRPKIVNEQKLSSPNLGRTPEFTHSIPSLLVFHTHENPYKESFCIENFNEKKKSKNNDDDSKFLTHLLLYCQLKKCLILVKMKRYLFHRKKTVLIKIAWPSYINLHHLQNGTIK